MQEAKLHLIGQNRVADINGGQIAGFRNKIIGGDFSTNPWQRGTNFGGIAGTSVYTADRWQFQTIGTSVWTVARDPSNNPSVAQAGKLVTHNLILQCTTADATVDAGDVTAISQYIEGYNFISLAQRPMVLTFWHFHSKAGTYCVAFKNSVGDRTFVSEYTQIVPNAWEYSKIVIPASPAAGSWNYTNGIGVAVQFTFRAGTNYQTTPGVWQTGNFYATANQVNGADAVNNNFRIALVQLESGTQPTPFEDRTFQMELALCQRYYEKSYNLGDAPGTSSAGGVQGATFAIVGPSAIISTEISFKVRKRPGPTITTYVYDQPNFQGNWTFTSSTAVTNLRVVNPVNVGETGFQLQATTGTDIYAFGQWTANAEF